MRVVLVALSVLCLASIAVQAQNTFCERYSLALFSNATDPDIQKSLVDAVVTRAITGASAGGSIQNDVVGLVNEMHNKPYFNGTFSPFVNYLTNDAARTTLVDHLDRFFMSALGCRAGSAKFPWASANLYTLHRNMNINKATQDAFVGQVAASLTSFGVPTATTATSDLAYVVALMSQFNRYGTPAVASSICTAADCDLAHGFAEFDITPAGAFSVMSGGTQMGTSVTINTGDYVHWNMDASDVVTEADSATGTTAKTGGFSSGSTSNARSYTMQFNTAGTYYFYNAGSGKSANRGMITVTGTSMTSTGAMGGASRSVEVGIALGVAAVAAFVLA